jgi:RNA polymerase sigma-70 factor, ECF subfamily
MERMRSERDEQRRQRSEAAGGHSDDEIIRRVLSGERSLFELLMRRHNQQIYRAVIAIVRDAEEAQEVMQQAYLSAWTHLRDFAGESRFATWLTRIAVHQALRGRRRHRRNLAVVAEEPGGDIAEAAPSPEEQAMAGEMRVLLERAVMAMPVEYRAVVILRDVQGLTSEEAAEVLDVTSGVIRTRLHRARAMLRDQLVKEGRKSLAELLPFAGSRCDRVVEQVLMQIDKEE